LDRMDEALAKLRQAIALEGTAHGYTQIAEVYAKRRHWAEAMEALSAAEKLDLGYAPIYVYRGNIYFNTGQYALAIEQYGQALKFDANNQEALRNLENAKRLLRTVH